MCSKIHFSDSGGPGDNLDKLNLLEIPRLYLASDFNIISFLDLTMFSNLQIQKK